MKKLVILTALALLLAAPYTGIAEEKAAEAGNDSKKAEAPAKKKKFIIHLTNGGSVETNNYTIEKNAVRVMLSSGAIYLDRDMVSDIEEVEGVEEDTVQTIIVEPARGAEGKKPAEVEVITGDEAERQYPTTQTDNDGHSEKWWKARVDEWVEKKTEAIRRYAEAKDNWNRYDGLLNSLSAGGDASQYDLVRYQDLRGSARVEMDRAEADIADAEKMLKDILPEEARKAGAPPGWVRY